MSAQISTLCEIFVAELARKGSLTSVLSEVIPKIARLFKHATAIGVHALEVEFLSLGLRILDLDSLMPVAWNPLEMLRRIF